MSPPTPPQPPSDDLESLLARRAQPEWDVESAWRTVHAATERSDDPAPVRKAPRTPIAPPLIRRQTRVPMRIATAAAAIGVLGAGAVLYPRPSRQPVDVSAAATSFREYATRRGERASITLSDGSTVTMAPGSRLRIPDDFGRFARELELVGEAVFSVRHDSTAFRVRVGRTEVTDIGTVFGIRAYDSANVAVAVIEGEVAIRARSDSGSHESPQVHALAGMIARINGDSVTTRRGGVERFLSWTNGTLTFTREPLRDVLPAIERWYDLEIVANAALLERRITADLVTTDRSVMLKTLAAALDAHVTRNGNRFTLDPIGR